METPITVESTPAAIRPERILNNSRRRREVKRAALLASQAEREARGWVHPKNRPPKRPTAGSLDMVRDMMSLNNLGAKSLFDSIKRSVR